MFNIIHACEQISGKALGREGWEMFQSFTWPRCQGVCGAASPVWHTWDTQQPQTSLRASRIQGGDPQLGTKPPTPQNDSLVSFPLARLWLMPSEIQNCPAEPLSREQGSLLARYQKKNHRTNLHTGLKGGDALGNSVGLVFVKTSSWF